MRRHGRAERGESSPVIRSVMLGIKTDYLDNLRREVFDHRRERVNEENRTSVVVLLTFTFVIIAANLVLQPLPTFAVAS